VEILRCGTLGRRTRAALAGFVAERA